MSSSKKEEKRACAQSSCIPIKNIMNLFSSDFNQRNYENRIVKTIKLCIFSVMSFFPLFYVQTRTHSVWRIIIE